MEGAQYHQSDYQSELDMQDFLVRGALGDFPVVHDVADPGQDQDADAGPSQGPETTGHRAKKISSKQRGCHLAQNGGCDDGQEEHAADPDDRRQDVQPYNQEGQHGEPA